MVPVLTTVPNEKSVAEVNQEPISKVSIQIIIQAESIFFPLSQEQVNLFLIVIPQDDSNEINYTLPENHTVELIVSHRKAPKSKGGWELLCRWKGYTSDFDSWEAIKYKKKEFPEVVREYYLLHKENFGGLKL